MMRWSRHSNSPPQVIIDEPLHELNSEAEMDGYENNEDDEKRHSCEKFEALVHAFFNEEYDSIRSKNRREGERLHESIEFNLVLIKYYP